jgi:hypothetical protein
MRKLQLAATLSVALLGSDCDGMRRETVDNIRQTMQRVIYRTITSANSALVSARNSMGVLRLDSLINGYTGVRPDARNILTGSDYSDASVLVIIGESTTANLFRAVADTDNPYSCFVGLKINALADALIAYRRRPGFLTDIKEERARLDLIYVYERYCSV